MFCNGIIVGAGLVGSAIAYELSRRGVRDLHVFDPDILGKHGASEKNLGALRQLWDQPANIAMAQETIRLAERLGDQVGFERTPHLWLIDRAAAEKTRELLAKAIERKLGYEEISLTEIRRRYPFLDKSGSLAFGVRSENEGLIDASALRRWFREEATARGVIFHDRVWACRVSELHKSVWMETRRFETDSEATTALRDPVAYNLEEIQPILIEGNFLIMSAGAWAHELLLPIVPAPQCDPIRRQACLFRAEGSNFGSFGVIVDSSRAYFRAVGDQLLGTIAVAKEPPGYRQDHDSTFFESYLWPALYERSTQMERLKPVRGWATPESTTPDRTGIVGRVSGYHHLYEAHGFAGQGVMHCYGAAIALADLLTDKRQSAFDAACLSRERFAAGSESKRLPESWAV